MTTLSLPSLDAIREQAARTPAFRGPLGFCSNMHPARVFGFPSAEHAYVASKTTEPAIRARIKAEPSPHRVKCMGNPRHKLCIITSENLRPEWTQRAFRLKVMKGILAEKFGPKNPHLVELLLATVGVALIERNTWRDLFWGTFEGLGEDHLGRLLTERRAELLVPAH